MPELPLSQTSSDALRDRNDRQRGIDLRQHESKASPAVFPSAPLFPSAPVECDLCRSELTDGQGYYQLVLGMDDTPSVVGSPPGRDSTVETTTEMTVCAHCEPRAAAAFDRLLKTFWDLRAPDPNEPLSEDALSEAVAPTERST